MRGGGRVRTPHSAPVAQLDRASASGAEGQRFEPSRAHLVCVDVVFGDFRPRWLASCRIRPPGRVVPEWAPGTASTLSVRDVAQPGSAPHWGCGGRRFKSGRPD